jgi:hypothetical protein
MNKFKEKPIEKEIEEEPNQPRKENKITRSISDVVSGNFLSKEATVQALPFVFYMAFLAICYIANGYYAEEKVRDFNKVTNDLKELHSEYITKTSELMFVSKQSEVAKATMPMGIKESVVPPKKIVVKNVTTPNND